MEHLAKFKRIHIQRIYQKNLKVMWHGQTWDNYANYKVKSAVKIINKEDCPK